MMNWTRLSHMTKQFDDALLMLVDAHGLCLISAQGWGMANHLELPLLFM